MSKMLLERLESTTSDNNLQTTSEHPISNNFVNTLFILLKARTSRPLTHKSSIFNILGIRYPYLFRTTVWYVWYAIYTFRILYKYTDKIKRVQLSIVFYNINKDMFLFSLITCSEQRLINQYSIAMPISNTTDLKYINNFKVSIQHCNLFAVRYNITTISYDR